MTIQEKKDYLRDNMTYTIGCDKLDYSKLTFKALYKITTYAFDTCTICVNYRSTKYVISCYLVEDEIDLEMHTLQEYKMQFDEYYEWEE